MCSGKWSHQAPRTYLEFCAHTMFVVHWHCINVSKVYLDPEKNLTWQRWNPSAEPRCWETCSGSQCSCCLLGRFSSYKFDQFQSPKTHHLKCCHWPWLKNTKWNTTSIRITNNKSKNKLGGIHFDMNFCYTVALL